MIVKIDPATLWQEALSHFEAGRHSTAEACCRDLIACARELPMSYAMLSRLAHQRGLIRTATFHAYEACRRIANANCREILWISTALLEVGERGPAHEVLSFIDPHAPAHRGALRELGQHYLHLGDQPRASYCLELAESFAARSRNVRVPVHT